MPARRSVGEGGSGPGGPRSEHRRRIAVEAVLAGLPLETVAQLFGLDRYELKRAAHAAAPRPPQRQPARSTRARSGRETRPC